METGDVSPETRDEDTPAPVVVNEEPGPTETDDDVTRSQLTEEEESETYDKFDEVSESLGPAGPIASRMCGAFCFVGVGRAVRVLALLYFSSCSWNVI